MHAEAFAGMQVQAHVCLARAAWARGESGRGTVRSEAHRNPLRMEAGWASSALTVIVERHTIVAVATNGGDRTR